MVLKCNPFSWHCIQWTIFQSTCKLRQVYRPLDGNGPWMVTRPRLPSKGQQSQLPSKGQALRWQALRRQRKLMKNNDRWPFVSIRMLLEIHPFTDEFSLHLYIHKQQLTKSASHTTELVNQVPKWLYLLMLLLFKVSIPLKWWRHSPSRPHHVLWEITSSSGAIEKEKSRSCKSESFFDCSILIISYHNTESYKVH